MVSFDEQKILTLIKSDLLPFKFIAFCVISKSFIVLAFTFRSVIHFKLIFVCDVIWVKIYLFCHIDI